MLTFYLRGKLPLSTTRPFLSIVLGVTFQLALLSCNNSSDNKDNSDRKVETIEIQESNKKQLEVIIDIKELANKSIAEVEKLLGKAESKEPVKGYPCKNSNCTRAYFRSGKYEIIFKDSKADRITINESPDLTKSNNAIQALGIPKSAPSFTNPNTVARWNGIEGLHEVSFFSDYILVQVAQPE